MARDKYDTYYHGGTYKVVGGVPCRFASKPGKAYAEMLRGDKLGKLSNDVVREREAEWAASEVRRLVGLTIDRNYGESVKAWHHRAVSAYYSAMTKLGRPVVAAAVVDESEPDMFAEVEVVEDEVEPDLVAIRMARALEIDEAVDAAADERPVVEFGAIEVVVDEAPAVCGFRRFLDECEAEERARAAAVEAAPVEPAAPTITVADLPRLLADRPARAPRAPRIAPANLVPVEPFVPQPVEDEPAVVIDWIAARDARRLADRAARIAAATPAPAIRAVDLF